MPYLTLPNSQNHYINAAFGLRLRHFRSRIKKCRPGPMPTRSPTRTPCASRAIRRIRTASDSEATVCGSQANRAWRPNRLGRAILTRIHDAKSPGPARALGPLPGQGTPGLLLGARWRIRVLPVRPRPGQGRRRAGAAGRPAGRPARGFKIRRTITRDVKLGHGHHGAAGLRHRGSWDGRYPNIHC
jgi:hypothetical protein